MNNRSALAEEPSREPSVFLFHGTDLPTAERLAENELDDGHELIYPERFSDSRAVYVLPVPDREPPACFASAAERAFVYGLQKCAISGLYEGCEHGDVGIVRWECPKSYAESFLERDLREPFADLCPLFRVGSLALRDAVSQGRVRSRLFSICGAYTPGARAAYLRLFRRMGILVNERNNVLANECERRCPSPTWGWLERMLVKRVWRSLGCDSDEFTRSLMASELD